MSKLAVLLCLLQVAFGIDPIVRIGDGAVRGSILKDLDGNDYFSFQSIPFAKPPVGQLRFKDPQPVEKWTHIRDATKEAPLCRQKPFMTGDELVGVEDCLYLNVYTPQLRPRKLLAVIVFIHGGGFMEGSGSFNNYGPSFLVTEGVIVVTINYRLAIFGFLSFDNPAVGVPGNAGMKDQTAALRWVRKNIIRFGGDPNKVTIVGESAGGASVHLHVLSPLSRGLFQRAVMQSGNALAPWCMGESNNGVATAKALGFEDDNESAMLEFLRNANNEQLKAALMNSSTVIPLNQSVRFAPSIERNCENAFLSDYPRNIIKHGYFNRNVPLMLGFTSAEGMVLDVFYALRDGTYIPWPTEKLVSHHFNLNPTQRAELEKEIDDFYNIQDLSDPYGHINLQSDAFFTFSTYETIFGHLPWRQDIYFYLFSSDSELNFLKNSNPTTKNYKGVCHWDDMWYIFTHAETPISAYTPGSIENRAVKNSVRLLVNFAKYGKPTLRGDDAQWKRVTNNSINYLNIDLDQNYLGTEVYRNRAVFWCDVCRQYNLANFCPPTWTNTR